MSVLLRSTKSRYNLSILLGDDLSSANDLLRALSSAGVCVHNWSLASTEWPGQTRLIVDVSGDENVIGRLINHCDFQIHDASQSVCMELALITVSAKGSAQDEASSIVATAGGRLVALDDDRFTAQLTDRTEKIDALLDRLRQIAAIESVRSGSLSIRAT